MKKTAMQLLIEQLEEQKKAVPIEAYQKGLDYAIQAAKLKLETEQEQIEEVYISSAEQLSWKPEADDEVMAQQYYKETYG